MLGAVANRGAAVASQPLQVPGCGPGDDGIGLLCLPSLEHAGSLEYEAAGPAGATSNHPRNETVRSRFEAAITRGNQQRLDVSGRSRAPAGYLRPYFAVSVAEPSALLWIMNRASAAVASAGTSSLSVLSA
jgi:hypothetical protein